MPLHGDARPIDHAPTHAFPPPASAAVTTEEEWTLSSPAASPTYPLVRGPAKFDVLRKNGALQRPICQKHAAGCSRCPQAPPHAGHHTPEQQQRCSWRPLFHVHAHRAISMAAPGRSSLTWLVLQESTSDGQGWRLVRVWAATPAAHAGLPLMTISCTPIRTAAPACKQDQRAARLAPWALPAPFPATCTHGHLGTTPPLHASLSARAPTPTCYIQMIPPLTC